MFSLSLEEQGAQAPAANPGPRPQSDTPEPDQASAERLLLALEDGESLGGHESSGTAATKQPLGPDFSRVVRQPRSASARVRRAFDGLGLLRSGSSANLSESESAAKSAPNPGVPAVTSPNKPATRGNNNKVARPGTAAASAGPVARGLDAVQQATKTKRSGRVSAALATHCQRARGSDSRRPGASCSW